MLKPCVLSGTDLTITSRLPAQRAQRLARDLDMRFVLAHVMPSFSTVTAHALVPAGWTTNAGLPPRASGSRALATAAKMASDKLSTWVRSTRVDPDATRVGVGAPHSVLLAVAKANKARVIVTGVHRPGSKAEAFFLGTTTDRLLRQSSTPVLLARRSAQRSYRTALVAVDLGDSSVQVVRKARELFPDVRFQLLHAAPHLPKKDPMRKRELQRLRGALDDVAAGAGLAAGEFTSRVVEGEARKSVLREAAARDVDVIVVGTRGRKGLERFLLGSVAEYVLRAARSDVLAIPPS